MLGPPRTKGHGSSSDITEWWTINDVREEKIFNEPWKKRTETLDMNSYHFGQCDLPWYSNPGCSTRWGSERCSDLEPWWTVHTSLVDFQSVWQGKIRPFVDSAPHWQCLWNWDWILSVHESSLSILPYLDNPGWYQGAWLRALSSASLWRITLVSGTSWSAVMNGVNMSVLLLQKPNMCSFLMTLALSKVTMGDEDLTFWRSLWTHRIFLVAKSKSDVDRRKLILLWFSSMLFRPMESSCLCESRTWSSKKSNVESQGWR